MRPAGRAGPAASPAAAAPGRSPPPPGSAGAAPSGRTGVAGPASAGSATTPAGGRNPARVAASAGSGQRDERLPHRRQRDPGARPPSGATGRAPTTGAGCPRAEQLLHGHAERAGQRERHPQRRVGVPGLDRGDGLPRHPGHAGQLLLREARGPAGPAAAASRRRQLPLGPGHWPPPGDRQSGAVRAEVRRVQHGDLDRARCLGLVRQPDGQHRAAHLDRGLPAGPAGRQDWTRPASTSPRSGLGPRGHPLRVHPGHGAVAGRRAQGHEAPVADQFGHPAAGRPGDHLGGEPSCRIWPAVQHREPVGERLRGGQLVRDQDGGHLARGDQITDQRRSASRRSAASRPVYGSSSSSASQCASSSRPSATRCACPPDSRAGRSPSSPLMPSPLAIWPISSPRPAAPGA